MNTAAEDKLDKQVILIIKLGLNHPLRWYKDRWDIVIDTKAKFRLIEGYPEIGSVEHIRLWERLISKLPISLDFCEHPTDEMISLHKALYEI